MAFVVNEASRQALQICSEALQFSPKSVTYTTERFILQKIWLLCLLFCFILGDKMGG